MFAVTIEDNQEGNPYVMGYEHLLADSVVFTPAGYDANERAGISLHYNTGDLVSTYRYNGSISIYVIAGGVKTLVQHYHLPLSRTLGTPPESPGQGIPPVPPQGIPQDGNAGAPSSGTGDHNEAKAPSTPDYTYGQSRNGYCHVDALADREKDILDEDTALVLKRCKMDEALLKFHAANLQHKLAHAIWQEASNDYYGK